MLNDVTDIHTLKEHLSLLHLDVIPSHERAHRLCKYFRQCAWDRIEWCKLCTDITHRKIVTNVSKLTGDVRDWVSVRTPTPEDLEDMRQIGVYYPHTLGRFGNE